MITAEYYGRTAKGEEVYSYTLQNDIGTAVKVIEYGCVITNVFVKDKNGNMRDVVLGYDKLEDYEKGNASFGSFVGRYANRIEDAKAVIDGETYYMPPNDGKNHLHGVLTRKVFKGSIADNSLVLCAVSEEGDDALPGNLNITVTYTLTEDNALVLDYKADTDKETIVNFTNHSYFNLNGDHADDIAAQSLWLQSSSFTENNAENCPTGRILPVKGTPMDFTVAKPIGKDINADYYQLKLASGYDHNFILDKENGELALAAIAKSEESGITMETYTTQPALQLYTANFLGNGDVLGKNKKAYQTHCAFCLETQHYPCTPSHPEFPRVALLPKEEYHETTVYKFV
ncbi:MAG: aldose epimerase family protein [Oscillospiraceae bacterium]